MVGPDHKTPPDSQFIRSLLHTKRMGPERRWKSADGDFIYEWDGFHGHVELYDDRGRHLAVLDPTTGAKIKGPVRGRTIDV